MYTVKTILIYFKEIMFKFILRVLRKIRRMPQECAKQWKWWDTVRFLYNKDGIEFGGPTELFYHPMHRMKLYPYIKSLDGCNIFENNFFQSNLNSIFSYHKNKTGVCFNVDTADIESLKNIKKKYDFILSSHHIEHIANPIKAITAWKDILKKDGYVLAILPHKEYTFDKMRPLTKLSHIIEDYKKNTLESDSTHIQEQIKLQDWSMCGMKDFENLSKRNAETRVVHHHCFNTQLVKEMFEYAKYRTVKCYYIGNGNIVYLGQKQ